MKTTLKTEYHNNGQKMEERNYKDGKEEGPLTYWYENGVKGYEWNCMDGKKMHLRLNGGLGGSALKKIIRMERKMGFVLGGTVTETLS